MLHLHPIDAASAATSQLDRNRRQFRTANTFHAGWSRPAVPASVSRFSSCCRAPRRLRAEGTTRSLRCGGAEDGHPSQDSATASPSRPGRTPPLGDPATPSSGGVLNENLTCHNSLKAPHYTARRGGAKTRHVDCIPFRGEGGRSVRPPYSVLARRMGPGGAVARRVKPEPDRKKLLGCAFAED